MRLIKIASASLNTTVGAFDSNKKKIQKAMEAMAKENCTLGCFQEQVISGYPCEDLIQWKEFVQTQWLVLEELVDFSGKLKCETVFLLGMTVEHRGNLYNSAAVFCKGFLLGIVPKEKLPTYDIFYEGRTLSRGIPYFDEEISGVSFGDMIFQFPFGILGCEVCEDIWSPDGPMRRRAYSGAEVIVNLSASPFRIGVVNTRREMISTRASDNQSLLIYVNQYGGNDSLVFDGGAFVNQNGQMIGEAPRWKEGVSFFTVDLDRTNRLRYQNTTWRSDCEQFLSESERVPAVLFNQGPKANGDGFRYPVPAHRSFFLPENPKSPGNYENYFNDMVEALITGLDYFNKTKAFSKIGISLSGGKDSLLSLILVYLFAERHFGGLKEAEKKAAIQNFIHCFSMPAQFNSDETRNIARTIALELGVTFKEISIQDAFEKEKAVTKEMLGDEEITPITLMNIQARIRGERMLNWANSSGGMWIQTGNMSEKAVGYTTIGGDMMGAYSLIANVPKTVVIECLKFLYEKYRWKALGDVLNSKASAELAFDQEDEKDLMPFPVLDACMFLFAEEKKSPREVYFILKTMWNHDELKAMAPHYKTGMLKEWVTRFIHLFRVSLFKWVLTPQSVHVGKLELDRERALQLPVVQSCEWLEGELE
ncbi:MAG: NAD(+) synthase [Spirochaetales bacterium]|nr:NAD(+) synthase [Spirochaetales bacterium]